LFLLPFACLAVDQNKCHFAIKISVEVHIRAAPRIDSRSNQKVKLFPYCDWSESNRNPDSFVPVGKLAICHGRLANKQKNLTTQKIKQGLRLVLCEIAYSMSIHSSQCTFHGFIKGILPVRNRNVRCCKLHERTKRTVGAYLVSNF